MQRDEAAAQSELESRSRALGGAGTTINDLESLEQCHAVVRLKSRIWKLLPQAFHRTSAICAIVSGRVFVARLPPCPSPRTGSRRVQCSSATCEPAYSGRS